MLSNGVSRPITSVGQHHAPIIAGTEATIIIVIAQQLALEISYTDSSASLLLSKRLSPQPPFLFSLISKVCCFSTFSSYIWFQPCS